MKHYPSIKYKYDPDLTYWLFDKLDGSNIRAEWNPKSGFYKFGSRKILLNEDSALAEAKTLIEAQAPQLERVLNNVLKAKGAVLFFEFFGPGSFAGQHKGDETHECRLIDCDLKGQGQMDPEAFLWAFGDAVELPRVVHQGKVTEELLEDIRNSKVEGISFEGVVGKSQKPSKWLPPHMFKQKTKAWIDAVKAKYGDKAEDFI